MAGTPQLYETPAVALQAELYQSLLADALQQVAYEAARAGLGAGAGVSWPKPNPNPNPNPNLNPKPKPKPNPNLRRGCASGF